MGKPWTRKGSLVAVAVALAAAGLALAGAVSASAHDGQGRDDGTGAAATETRGHEADTQQEDQQSSEDGNATGRPLLKVTLAPSIPGDPTIHGVAPGSLPWVLDRGSVRLKGDGRLRVEIQGLVIPIEHTVGTTTFPAGTARPVTTVSASLYCAPDGTGAAATTAAVPISESGDATIAETISVPAACFAPVVLVHPNGLTAAYIAVTGWR
jgi:hypothetical protein